MLSLIWFVHYCCIVFVRSVYPSKAACGLLCGLLQVVFSLAWPCCDKWRPLRISTTCRSIALMRPLCAHCFLFDKFRGFFRLIKVALNWVKICIFFWSSQLSSSSSYFKVRIDWLISYRNQLITDSQSKRLFKIQTFEFFWVLEWPPNVVNSRPFDQLDGRGLSDSLGWLCPKMTTGSNYLWAVPFLNQKKNLVNAEEF